MYRKLVVWRSRTKLLRAQNGGTVHQPFRHGPSSVTKKNITAPVPIEVSRTFDVELRSNLAERLDRLKRCPIHQPFSDLAIVLAPQQIRRAIPVKITRGNQMPIGRC